MVNLLNKKLAFSLFEALVVMGIVAIFVAASTTVFTKRRTTVRPESHGRFECYYNTEGKLTQQYFVDSTEDNTQLAEATHPTDNKCTFNLQQNASSYIINLVGGGGGGNASTGGISGQFKSSETKLTDNIDIFIGKGGALNNPGEDTYISYSGKTDEIIRVKGGNSSFDIDFLNARDIKSCTVQGTYNSENNEVCTIKNDKIEIQYYNKDREFKTNDIYFDDLKTSAQTGSIYVYRQNDNDSYEIALEVYTNNTVNTAESWLDTYIKISDIQSGIKDARPGNSGARGQGGKSGGVIIIW